MKHTLPWNVTGIPPEAREVVRAAAHREGITVGEWLTRRILADQAKPETVGGPKEEAPSTRKRAAGEPEPRRKSEEPRLDQSTDLFRRIDETLGQLARRLESGERLQREAQLAMSAAANEINAATRDQAQAFQHITARIERVERQGDTTALRDAVRGLHQGLSRLAEQIAKTASDSTNQIASLSTNVETLAGKVAAAREESDRLAQSFEEKLATLAERVKQVEEERVATVRELTNRVERAEQHVEKRLKETEARIGAGGNLDETVTKLEQRMSAAEERLGESLGRHLAAIERALENINGRLDRAEKRDDANPAPQEELNNLAARVTSDANKTRESLSEIETQLLDTVRRITAMEAAIPHEPRAATGEPFAVGPVQAAETELPPFVQALLRTADSSEPPIVTEPLRRTVSEAAAPAHTAYEPVSSSTENYLAQARRAVRAAMEAENDATNRSGPMRMGLERAGSVRKSGVRRLATAAGFLVLVGIGYSAVRLQSDFRPREADGTVATEAAPPQNKTPASFGAASLNAKPTSAPPAPAAAALQRTEQSAPVQTANTAPPNPAAATTASATGGLASLLAQANSGNMKAATSLGLKYADGDGIAINESEAARWLSKAANAGEAVAAYRLGTLYERGRGVTVDAKQAMRWYAEAAMHGNRRAMHNLAVGYADGVGGEKNFAEAARWFRAAAELGLTDSQFNIAVLYERGLGVKQSLSEAYKWYAIAAASGDAESKTRVSVLANQLQPAERASADRAVKAYKPEPINIAANES